MKGFGLMPHFVKIEELRLIKKDKRGAIYDCDKVILIERKKGSVSADHVHEQGEVLFLIAGKVRLTVGDETAVAEAPCRIEIAGGIYHKIVALSKVKLLEYRFLRKKSGKSFAKVSGGF